VGYLTQQQLVEVEQHMVNLDLQILEEVEIHQFLEVVFLPYQQQVVVVE
jgi:hypothetical protein